MKKLGFIISLAILTLAVGGSANPNAPTDVLLIERQDGVIVRFDIELTQTAAARERGLMWRSKLRARTGMLFDFGAPVGVRMWMKNTLIPLDMLFADEGGQVIAITERTVPHSLDLIAPEVPIRYVLEINGGEAQHFYLQVGDRLLIP